MDCTAPRRPSTLAGLLLLMAVSACSGGSRAPVASPTPETEGNRSKGSVVPALEAFELAVSRGTRTRTGKPGPKYWQQWADYRLEAELNPVSKRLTGKGTITYYNRSPGALSEVYVHLLHNIFAPNSRHNTDVPWTVEGIELSRVAVSGQELKRSEKGPGYQIGGTIMRIQLPRPLPPGGSVPLDFAWKLRIPPDGAPRGGQDGEAFYINYWYPQMAVYDDVNGWQIDQYLGNAEFYMGYGNYDIAVTVPSGWLVDATGRLQNPAEVLSPQTLARLDSASRAPGIVHVVTDLDREPGRATTAGSNGKLTWKFRAENVRDVSWATSARYLWDATNAVVGDATGDGRPDTTAIYAFYRPEQRRISNWGESARYSRHSIEFFSKYLSPYPYPHMSAVDGPTSCGGMEYPMMTCIGGQWDTLGLYEVTTHEIGHMWFPMIVGSDEKRYAWMDEGLTQFDQSQSMDDFFKDFDDEARNRKNYLDIAETGNEAELMRHGDRYPSYAAYGVASYYKPASVLVALRGVLGPETFHKAYTEYIRRWSYKHPSPYDFFHTFDDVSGQDLSWFWRTWFFETWKLDQAIDTVTTVGDSLEVAIENRGKAQMPVSLTVTRASGRVDRLTIPANVWFSGERRHSIKIGREPAVKSIEIDAGNAFPDFDRSNQVWPR